MLFIRNSLKGYLSIRRRLERRGFKQLLSDSQKYVLFGKGSSYLLAHSYSGEGKFYMAVARHKALPRIREEF